jgi:hypothetical protein
MTIKVKIRPSDFNKTKSDALKESCSRIVRAFVGRAK